MPGIIRIQNRRVVAISKHIESQEAGAGVGVAVGIDESMIQGIIVSTLQIIEARVGIVVVASIAQGIQVGDVVCICNTVAVLIGNAENFAPGVVAVPGHDGSVFIQEHENISLEIQHIVVCLRSGGAVGIDQGIGGAVGVVEEIQHLGGVHAVGDGIPYHLAVLGDIVVGGGPGVEVEAGIGLSRLGIDGANDHRGRSIRLHIRDRSNGTAGGRLVEIGLFSALLASPFGRGASRQGGGEGKTRCYSRSIYL